MIKDIIENLEVAGWSFSLQTVNNCILQHGYFQLNGEMCILDVTDIFASNFVTADKNDLLVKSKLSVGTDEWNILVFKVSNELYISVAFIEVNEQLLAIKIISHNTAQFSNAQKELATILKSVDVSKIRLNIFQIDDVRFISDVWRSRKGRLICDDGICNISSEETIASVTDRVSKNYKLVCKDAERNYFKFQTESSIIQIMQIHEVVFYAICNHELPLYQEIKEA